MSGRYPIHKSWCRVSHDGPCLQEDQPKMKTRKDVAELLYKIVVGAEFQQAHARVTKETEYLRDMGQKEYAHDDQNALANFDRTGAELELEPTKVLWIFWKKHADGVLSWINGFRSQREDVRGRINDMIVYLVLLRALIDREEGK